MFNRLIVGGFKMQSWEEAVKLMKDIPVMGVPEDSIVTFEKVKDTILNYYNEINDKEFCNVYSVIDPEENTPVYYIVCSSLARYNEYFEMIEMMDNPLSQSIENLRSPRPICGIHVVDVLGELKLEGKLDINKFLKIVERKHPKTYEEIYEIYK